MLAAPGAVAAEDCPDSGEVTARVLCLADRAVANGSAAACESVADDARVRDQCLGVYAVRTGSPGGCRAIPGDSTRAAGLRQICLSDVAIVTGDGELCGEIDDPGLRDTCHLKLARDTDRPALCERIEQSALRALCER